MKLAIPWLASRGLFSSSFAPRNNAKSLLSPSERQLLFVMLAWMMFGLSSSVNAADWIGSESCASGTCHGGIAGRGPAWNSSYSLSRTRDPHSTSGALLYDDDSRRIVMALSPDATTELAYDVVLRQRCISCHLTATPDDVASTMPLEPEQVGDGVSCESCHGPAGAWKESHVLESWTGPMRFEPATGMLDTESIVGRADGCVRCHVGSRTADGMVRDMNHDLIAAGHPALRFDLLTYNDNMPNHWSASGAAEQKFSESSIRVRVVGRLIGSAAAATLSSERATASLAPAAATHVIAPWPELSDFDCFACHQSLSSRAYRLPKTVDGKPSLQVSDGLPLWNAWFTSLDTGKLDKEKLETGKEVDSVWKFRPKPGGQAQWVLEYQKLADSYRKRAIAEASAEIPSATATITLIRNNLNKRAPRDWHSAAAMYLELDAAARDMATDPKTKTFGTIIYKSLTEKVAPLLLFDVSQADANARSRSPKDFDPRDFRDKTIKILEDI